MTKEITNPEKTVYLQDICWTPDDTTEEKANKEIHFIENIMGIQLFEYQKEFIRLYFKNNNYIY